ncbi:MAG: WbqC family protein [Saprospiraceae bacterium]|nr:WbqC family protein [Saprospiraceae bacterium]
MNALIESQYFPPLAYFSVLLKHEKVWIEQFENYQKGSYRNRCHIATANGLLRLSIPLEKGKNNQTCIKEVKIHNDTNWQIQHWRAIKSAYGNAPYFEYYADELLPFLKKIRLFI